jgi:hypothetical protein
LTARVDVMWFAFGVYCLLPAGAALFFRKKLPVPIYTFLLLPGGFLLVAYTMLRSAYNVLRRGGIEWRGTLYPLEILRREQQVKV